jgi:hypothetical protein
MKILEEDEVEQEGGWRDGVGGGGGGEDDGGGGGEVDAAVDDDGAQFTCFTGTKVPTLTQFTSAKVHILTQRRRRGRRGGG